MEEDRGYVYPKKVTWKLVDIPKVLLSNGSLLRILEIINVKLFGIYIVQYFFCENSKNADSLVKFSQIKTLAVRFKSKIWGW